MPLSKERARAEMYARRHPDVKPVLNLNMTNGALLLLPAEQRKAVLADIALHSIETPVTAGHKIAAISELNKMDHIYETGNTFNNIQINVVYESDKKEIEGNATVKTEEQRTDAENKTS